MDVVDSLRESAVVRERCWVLGRRVESSGGEHIKDLFGRRSSTIGRSFLLFLVRIVVVVDPGLLVPIEVIVHLRGGHGEDVSVRRGHEGVAGRGLAF